MTEERNTAAPETEESRNFILNLIDQDIAEGGQFQGQTVHTRFPPEPNGYLHIGHCKALCIDFGTAEKFGGLCNLRMDDTNPAKEDTEYVDAIQQDIHWLGFDWGDRFFYGSDYFEKDYEYAVELIKKGLAYVCELTPEEFKANRGDIGIPATSPYRDRPIEENLRLFEKMKNGEVEEGKMTLRAKIDLASGNLNLRDPIIYRIRFINHHRQGTKWCIYPMYDFAHPIQDALEGITHSLCSLEFESHRPLYDWVVSNVSIPYYKPRQIEFARLGIDHTVMSKRKLRQLVEEKLVSGWDDPRMPTLCGLRRRGYTARSIRNFCERIGVAKSPNTVEYGFLEHCLREDLNATAQRTMAVLHPVKLTVTNYPEGQSETFTVENNPTDPTQGTHEITFGRHLWIETEDFLEMPIPKYKRLYPDGPECRLKGAYLIALHRLCQGRERPCDGGAVRVRPQQPGRRPRRRTQGQGRYPPLGGCRQLLGCRGAAVRQPVLRSPARRPGQEFPGLPESRLPDGAAGLQEWNAAWPLWQRSSTAGRTVPASTHPPSSSCGPAISAWITGTARRSIWCSTAAFL